MARPRKKVTIPGYVQGQGPRDLSTIANRPLFDHVVDEILSRPLPVLKINFRRDPVTALDVEDRRLYHPLQAWRSPLTPRRKAALSTAKLSARKRGTLLPGRHFSWLPRFKDPRHVMICVRRKMRREVLHALARTGRGGGRKRRPRRNQWSDVRC